MKKTITIIFFLLNLNFICLGQDYIESIDLKLTKIDYETYYKKAEQTGEYGFSKIFLIDKNDNQIKEFRMNPEFYYSDGIVYESSEFEFKNVKKIIRIELASCACYCNTSKYYWLITNENKWIELPIIEEGITDFDLKRLDYEFDSNSDSILLIEYQDQMIKENDNSKFKLKNKSILKSYEWNGIKLIKK